MGKKPLLIGVVIFLGLAVFLFLGVFVATLIVEDGFTGSGRIALVRIEGIILDSKDATEEIRRFVKNPTVKAIVIRIDSPGGAVVPSQEIYDEIRRIKAESGKKVVASMGTVAASGGYYIASASDRIVANPGTLTGSIGVILEMANVAGLFQKIGVESVVIKSGEHKDLASPFRKMREEERKILQNVLDDVHNQFIEAVSEARGIQIKKVRELADGRIFTGRHAKDLGLVDELGGLQETIRLAARMVGIEGEPRVLESRKKISVLDLLNGQWMNSFSVPFKQGGQSISLKYMLSF